ncbi:MAG: cation:dicarboxylase symporter family transporter [Actinomycetia bacterium]|nr:cation:dicarboxylase symporter family transporter [Actinomycetes bacterium]
MPAQPAPVRSAAGAAGGPSRRRGATHYLYLAVIVAAVAGAVLGLVAPDTATSLKPLGTGFVNLIKMMISPVIFCTLVLGIGSVRNATKVGRVGGLALGYFVVMSFVALGIGLAVGNILHPGSGLHLTKALAGAGHAQAANAPAEGVDFVLGIIPTSFVSAFTEGQVLQTLLVALLTGFALQAMGPAGAPVLRGIGHLQKLVFKVLSMIMWAAPLGAFGALAAVVGSAGVDALKALATIMLGFYASCLLFVVVVLGLVLRLCTGINLFALLRYLAREFLLIVSTSSSESALPLLMAKMEHLGVSRPVVGITVPTGYSFNLDGTMIYLTMASLFIADAMHIPLSFGEQVSLLLFMMIASKGAAGVSGSGLASLATGLQSHKPVLVDGIGLIVGIDRFMSEARAVTNFAGNAVATVLIGTWTGEFDKARAAEVLAGRLPFDDTALADAQADGGQADGAQPDPGKEPVAAPASQGASGAEPALPAQPAAG